MFADLRIPYMWKFVTWLPMFTDLLSPVRVVFLPVWVAEQCAYCPVVSILPLQHT